LSISSSVLHTISIHEKGEKADVQHYRDISKLLLICNICAPLWHHGVNMVLLSENRPPPTCSNGHLL